MAAFAERRRIITMDNPDFEAGAHPDERAAVEALHEDALHERDEAAMVMDENDIMDESDAMAMTDAAAPDCATIVAFAAAEPRDRAPQDIEAEADAAVEMAADDEAAAGQASESDDEAEMVTGAFEGDDVAGDDSFQAEAVEISDADEVGLAAGADEADDTEADEAGIVSAAPDSAGEDEAGAVVDAPALVAADTAAADAAADEGEAADGEPQAAARPEEMRILEAMLFASSEPLDEKTLAARLPDGIEIRPALMALQLDYAARGINLVKVGGKWTFRTANDLAWLLSRETVEPRKLSRAALETLAIIAYHQPVTRAEIEEIRGVSTSKGSVDVLLQIGWIRPRGRRKAPGRPVTYGTTDQFLSQFSLEALNDLPGLEELKGSGLLDGRLPPGFAVPMPSDDPALREDEDPLEPGDLDLTLAPPVERTED